MPAENYDPSPPRPSGLMQRLRAVTYTVPWNLALIAFGSVLIAFALKTIAIPHGFISGGVSGLSLLFFYLFPDIGPGTWYYILNGPIFLLGWLFVSKRFFFYTLYGTLCVGLALSLFDFTSPIHDPVLAALGGGTIFGAGAGLALRTLGSTGGMDIIAVILNQRYNIRVGQVFFHFNLVLFLLSGFFLSLDTVLYSLGMVFIASAVTDYFLSMFNQRKMVLIISDKHDEITRSIHKTVHRGATLLYGRGAYSGRQKRVVLTVVNNIQLKRLEEVIYSIDPNAFTIVGNTLNVLGTGFSRRKVY
ncbi:MAG: YitT family protein [Desulfovibrionales bacterium]